MPKWQYDKINLNNAPRKGDDIDLLLDLGQRGWELVAITGNNIAYLKRRVSEPPGETRARPRPRSKEAGAKAT